jgi:hypothetical protein
MTIHSKGGVILLSAVALLLALACRALLDLPAGPVPAAPSGTIEPIECSDDACLQACIRRLERVLQTAPFDPIRNPIYEEQQASLDLVVYQVEGDQLTEPAVLHVPPDFQQYQADTAAHRRIWDFYTAIIPDALRSMVNKFIIFTDGVQGGLGAWVSPSETDEDFWTVGFDILDSDYPPYLADVLVHETGHLLTLNTAQVPIDEVKYYFYNGSQEAQEAQGCAQYVNAGGCSLPDSYINLFFQRFWRELHHEWWEVEQQAVDAQSYDEYLEIMEGFYRMHDELFRNSYAATNVKEDMAESFSYFVLNPRPTGEGVPDQKVQFYYEFPELVEYRRQIIQGLCAYVR